MQVKGQISEGEVFHLLEMGHRDTQAVKTLSVASKTTSNDTCMGER